MKLIFILTTLVSLSAFAQDQKAVATKKPTIKREEPPAPAPAKPPATDGSTKPPLDPAPPTDPKPTIWEKVQDKTGDAADYSLEKMQQAKAALGATRANREASRWTLSGSYSLFEMWTVSRYGLSVGYNRSASSTYELEYARGSFGLGSFGVDIGSIAEQRVALLWRSYRQRNGFNFVSGIYYNDLEVSFGSEYLASVPGGNIDLLKLKTLGVSWGLSNRWQTKGGFVWGADWISVALPLFILKEDSAFSTNDPEFREDAQDALDFFKRLPAISALKFQLGFSW